MRKSIILGLYFTFMSGQPLLAQQALLPANLQEVRKQIIELSKQNTFRTDNIEDVRAVLDPLVGQLGTWFDANRPGNEVELTQVPWKSIWYDDPTIEEFSNVSFGPVSIRLVRDEVYQVIEKGFYYNVSESEISFRGKKMRSISFLKGAYQLARTATPNNVGASELNVVDLEFVSNSTLSASLPAGINLRRLVWGVERGIVPVSTVPGPIGVTGELWNVYVDENLRIAAGFEDTLPGVLDLYILVRVSKTGPLK